MDGARPARSAGVRSTRSSPIRSAGKSWPAPPGSDRPPDAGQRGRRSVERLAGLSDRVSTEVIGRGPALWRTVGRSTTPSAGHIAAFFDAAAIPSIATWSCTPARTCWVRPASASPAPPSARRGCGCSAGRRPRSLDVLGMETSIAPMSEAAPSGSVLVVPAAEIGIGPALAERYGPYQHGVCEPSSRRRRARAVPGVEADVRRRSPEAGLTAAAR